MMEIFTGRGRIAGCGVVFALAIGALAAFGGFAGAAVAFPGQTVFVTTAPGTGCPPATLGGYAVRQLGPDTSSADGAETTHDGQVSFSVPGGGPLLHAHVPATWGSWSNDYGWGNPSGPAESCNGAPTFNPTNPAGDVYVTTPDDYSTTYDQADIWLPFQAQAVQFYVEPDDFATFDITAYDQSGQATATVPVNGNSGARYFGFWTKAGPYSLTHVHVACTPDCGGDGFAIGEFGLSLQKLARAN